MAVSGLGGMGGGMGGMSGCSASQHSQMGGANAASAKQNATAAKLTVRSSLGAQPNLGAKLDIAA